MKKVQVAQKAIIINPKDKILILKRGKTAPSNPLKWDLPGGELDFGEDAFVGIAREIEEEAGIHIKDGLKAFDVESHLDSKEEFGVTICYSVRVKNSKVVISSEHDEYKWIKKEDFKNFEAPDKIKRFISNFDIKSNTYKNMKKYVYLIHGWDGVPESGFRPWLKAELEKRDYIVRMPALPNANIPVVEVWLSFLQKFITSKPEETIIVGHSLGATLAIRYLESLPDGEKVFRVVNVAGVVDQITGFDSAEEKRIAQPWLEDNIDYKKVKNSVGEIIAFFSADDPYIPLASAEALKDRLGAKIIIEHGMGHYNGEAIVDGVPSILKEIIK